MNKKITDQEKEILTLGFGRFGFRIQFQEDAESSKVIFTAEDAKKILKQLRILDNAAGRL